MYESTPGATLRGIAADLGIVRGTLSHWVDLYGTGKTTAPDGTMSTRPLSGHRAGPRPPAGPETPEQKMVRLEAENAALRVERTKLATEREILRQAAKYFAGETNW